MRTITQCEKEMHKTVIMVTPHLFLSLPHPLPHRQHPSGLSPPHC